MTEVLETVHKLEAELKELQKKRGDAEYRLRTLENKEKAQQGLLGKRNRGEGNFNQQNKRTREINGEQFLNTKYIMENLLTMKIKDRTIGSNGIFE